jgi:hypothetical protein
MNKHIVKTYRFWIVVSFLVPWFPSKSGLIKKHTVKHTVGALDPSKSGLMNKHIVKHIVMDPPSVVNAVTQ